MMQVVVGENFEELNERLFMCLDANGEVQHSRNGTTVEIRPCIFQLKDPRKRISSLRGRKFNIGFAVAEMLWILSGRGDYDFITHYNAQMGAYFDDKSKPSHGAYGIRLRKCGLQRGIEEPIDQIYMTYRKLNKNRDDRQAVMTIWDVDLDIDRHSSDIPCNNWMHSMIRKNELHWTHVVRSNDLLWGVPYNLFNFTVLQELMASWTGADIGEYTHISDSLHLYSDVGDELNEIFFHIESTHPMDFDHMFLYDTYNPSVISESYSESHEHLNTIMDLEGSMRNITNVGVAESMSNMIDRVFDASSFWSNCAHILLSYNTYKNRNKNDKLKIFATDECLKIDNEFQFSMLDFILRRDRELLFRVEDLIPNRVFEEFESRYICYPPIGN